MANPLHHHLLLLLLLTFFTTTTSSSTARTTTTILPTQPAIQTEQQLHNIIEALIGAGDFSNWASVLSITDPSSFPLTATLFIPSDASITDPSLFNPSTIAYHIVPQQLSFSNLLSFQTGSKLPTLLPGKLIFVTNNSRLNYTIDDSRIKRPDLYINGAITIHGIESVLNYSYYGTGSFQDPVVPILEPESSPPDLADYAPELESERNGSLSIRHSDAPCSCVEFPVIILSVVFAVLGFKNHGFYPLR